MLANSHTVLTGSWHGTLHALVSSATRRLTLCAPYVSEHGASVVLNARKIIPSGIPHVLVLTDLSPLAICAGATDPSAIAMISRRLPNVRLVHLPRLHAKVYAADGARAVLTSGNLTGGGLGANYECGLFIDDAALARRIDQDIDAYSALGAKVDGSTLDQMCEIAVDAREAFREQTASASKDSVRRLRAVLRVASDTLVRARLAEGPIHTVFAKTIKFLLSRQGSLSTEQMHPMIQQMHPDLCDDTIDRVIDGKAYGKKWKHAVRTAQQQLKKQGVIALDNGAWTFSV